jgi:predicted RNase H-like HicB family nuclease
MKLHVVVEEDEAGYFVAEVPALPGCLSQGKTRDEAIANVKELSKDGLRSWRQSRRLMPIEWLRSWCDGRTPSGVFGIRGCAKI